MQGSIVRNRTKEIESFGSVENVGKKHEINMFDMVNSLTISFFFILKNMEFLSFIFIVKMIVTLFWISTENPSDTFNLSVPSVFIQKSPYELGKPEEKANYEQL